MELFKADKTFFNKKSGVLMQEHNESFTRWFSSKVEEQVVKKTLVPLKLAWTATDDDIIAALGGEEKAEVSLAEIWKLLKLQPRAMEKGLLVTEHLVFNKKYPSLVTNIFYVRDTRRRLRRVNMHGGLYFGEGWAINAGTIGRHRKHPVNWSGGDGNQVFVRKSTFQKLGNDYHFSK